VPINPIIQTRTRHFVTRTLIHVTVYLYTHTYIHTHILYRVGGTWPLRITRCTMLGHWWRQLYLLSYSVHYSVGYTRFISGSMSRHYNLCLHWVLAPWCLVSGRSFDVFSLRRLAANWLDYDWLFLLVTCHWFKVKVTLRLTASQSVSLGVEPHLGLMTRYVLLFDIYGLVFVGRPL
jgi:hypothetical protein